MTAPPRPRPSSLLVGLGWLRLALPGTSNGTDLPAADVTTRTAGFVRVSGVVAGSPGRDVPMRVPVLLCECWVAPAEGSQKTPWNRAGDLAERLVAATYDPQLMGRLIELGVLLGADFASYAPARVQTTTAVSEPERVENDLAAWARVDVDVEMRWTPLP